MGLKPDIVLENTDPSKKTKGNNTVTFNMVKLQSNFKLCTWQEAGSLLDDGAPYSGIGM